MSETNLVDIEAKHQEGSDWALTDGSVSRGVLAEGRPFLSRSLCGRNISSLRTDHRFPNVIQLSRSALCLFFDDPCTSSPAC